MLHTGAKPAPADGWPEGLSVVRTFTRCSLLWSAEAGHPHFCLLIFLSNSPFLIFTWRIIPLSHWLISEVVEGPQFGDPLLSTFNHLLNIIHWLSPCFLAMYLYFGFFIWPMGKTSSVPCLKKAASYAHTPNFRWQQFDTFGCDLVIHMDTFQICSKIWIEYPRKTVVFIPMSLLVRSPVNPHPDVIKAPAKRKTHLIPNVCWLYPIISIRFLSWFHIHSIPNMDTI